MISKFLEGLALVLGMCLLMHALFSDESLPTPTLDPVGAKRDRRAAHHARRAAYMAFGSTLLIYGLAGVMLRGM